MNWEATWLTVRLALLVSGLLLVIGLPIAHWITSSRWRWKFLVEAVVPLPLVPPPTVLGFCVLIAVVQESPIGRWFHDWTARSLAFSFEGLLVGSVLYSLPFAVQPFASGVAAVDKHLIDASLTLGVSRFRTFFRVIMPLLVASLIAGVVLSFAHTMGEFGVVLMVGGDIPGITRTVSIDIYDQMQALNSSSANHTSLALLLFSFVALSIVYGLNRRRMSIWGKVRKEAASA